MYAILNIDCERRTLPSKNMRVKRHCLLHTLIPPLAFALQSTARPTKGFVTYVCAQTPDTKLHLERRSLRCAIPTFVFYPSLPERPRLTLDCRQPSRYSFSFLRTLLLPHVLFHRLSLLYLL